VKVRYRELGDTEGSEPSAGPEPIDQHCPTPHRYQRSGRNPGGLYTHNVQWDTVSRGNGDSNSGEQGCNLRPVLTRPYPHYPPTMWTFS
jgi:hypothetical protein